MSWVVAVSCIVAGVGWLDLLRRGGVLPIGPRIPGALPLEQLAANDGQPFVRMLLAWLPVGALAGHALAQGSRATPRRGALGLAAVAAGLLAAVGAGSDAATISGPLSEHALPQLWRAGTLVAVAIIATGALVVLERGRPAAAQAPTGP
jgi:hypothetical protein